MARPRYTLDDRVNAIVMLAYNAGYVLPTATMLGIQEPTLSRWSTGRRHAKSRTLVLAMAQNKAADLSARCRDVARDAIEKCHASLDKASPAQLAVIAGIMIDKANLLDNLPTAIQGRLVTDGEKLQALKDAVRTLAARHGQVSPPMARLEASGMAESGPPVDGPVVGPGETIATPLET